MNKIINKIQRKLNYLSLSLPRHLEPILRRIFNFKLNNYALSISIPQRFNTKLMGVRK